MTKIPEFKDFVAHFPQQMSQQLCDYAREVVFLGSRYIFTRREGKRQFGFCTHCRQELETSGFKHGSKEVCSSCGSLCTIKASGKGRKNLIDEAYFVYYEKSILNPQAITARGIYAVRDYRGDYKSVETLIEVKAMYLFEPGNAVMFERPWLYYSDTHGMTSGQRWEPLKSISSLSKSVMFHKDCYCSYDSIRTAVVGTPFQYSTWEKYKGDDMVKFFALAAKYPCVEYLTKLGMSGIVDAKLSGSRTFGVINWNGRDPLKVLKMTKQEINEIRASNVNVDPWLLYLRRLSKRDGSNFSISEIARLRLEYPENYQSDLETAMARATLKRINGYFEKQLQNAEVHRRYDTKKQLLSTWNDYIKDCTRLGLDVSDEAVKFPKNLYQAHQNTIKQIKLKADEELNAKISHRCKQLKKMQFEARGLILRPARSSQELIDEGKALHHCVGTYADRYANGHTDIFVIRKADEPGKPFYTMEVRQGHIVQCRGLRNCVPTEDVDIFIKQFASKKLLTKRQVRTSIAV